ncbi:MAG: NAD(+) diphosphatase [Muribaculaceae bacterium]|nr:NAD(+) diphosphatase [Muribaculaceae bacterium]MDE6552697.1 NAD(+) diphosphatase [Muribaculaceae bacterium]
MNNQNILLKDGKVALIGNNFAHDEADAEWVELRSSWSRLGEEKWQLAARAQELANFRRAHRFCGYCGGNMTEASDISLRCEACGREIWPQLSPAMVVLVTRHDGEEALLVHAANFKHADVHALVAGFVETGETLEQCVAREVKEETSLEISDIRYVGSQSWPFPGQMMVGFVAEYVGGEISLSDGELTSAGWFTRENHPPLPSQPSLSRRIIDLWLSRRLPH